MRNSAWSESSPWKREVAGSNPAVQTNGSVMELVYMSVLETDAERLESSSLSASTNGRAAQA